MNKIRPIFIDGPLKGCQIELDESFLNSGYIVREVPDLMTVDFLTELPSDQIRIMPWEDIHYRFHMIGIFNHIMIVGSRQWDREKLDYEYLYHLIMSSAAKKAIWK